MKTFKFTTTLCAAALALGACSASGPRYTPRADIAESTYTMADMQNDRMDRRSYGRYEQREQCQNYRKLPRNTIDRCNETEIIADTIAEEKILSSYTILFDFDKSDIRADEQRTMTKLANEIDTYHPKRVTVTGYTDSSGKVDYNQALSERREQEVSRTLLEYGIPKEVLNRNARGEYGQAVMTPDGIRNQENRRVVIDFRS